MASTSLPTKYSESRTLSRSLHRVGEQPHTEFKSNILRFRKHFEQFNLDVAEICQWLMGIRPGGKHGHTGTDIFWNYFLVPVPPAGQEDADPDRCRRILFDSVSGIAPISSIDEIGPTEELRNTVRRMAEFPRQSIVASLFKRLGGYGITLRQIVLRSAADYIIAHYQRGVENWERQHAEWAKEKEAWEKRNPELTPEIRTRFNAIFKAMNIRDKRPRICSWAILKENRDDCRYAGIHRGKQNHTALCIKYAKFLKDSAKDINVRKYFMSNLRDYLAGKKVNPNARHFDKQLKTYLATLEVSLDTVKQWQGKFPHCLKLDDSKPCSFNKHTDLCLKYKELLSKEPDLQPLDAKYREWRRYYLSGPQKPSFKYPSAHTLPMPKIFGAGFYKTDFARSVVSLRLEDMAEGKFLDFGFRPWPKDYSPKPEEADITSVHVIFTGTHAHVGFRFKTKHLKSRFGVTQEEIDILRRHKYPRESQDQLFLDEAKQLLENSFTRGPEHAGPRIMAVDLGTTGSAVAIFDGDRFIETIPIANSKLGLTRPKEKMQGDKDNKAPGLTAAHLGEHIKTWSKHAAVIAEQRSAPGRTGEIRNHDMIRLALHMRWMIKDWTRANTAAITHLAKSNKADLIVFESMRGWSAPGRDRMDQDKKKKRQAFFAAGKIRHKTTEKAVELGMRTVTVPYRKSSQYCSSCYAEQKDKKKFENNKRKHLFICDNPGCGNKMNSDANAAKIIGLVYLGKVKLPVEVDRAGD